MSSEADDTFQQTIATLESAIATHRFDELYQPDAPLPSREQTKLVGYFARHIETLMHSVRRDPRSELPQHKGRVGRLLREAERYVVEHRRLASPLRWIPVSVMKRIFTYVAQPSATVMPNDGSHSDTFKLDRLPWELMHVCHSWRVIARSTPTLWRTLPTIDLDERHTEESAYIHFLSTLLQRGGACPISFRLKGRSFASISHKVTKLLARHAVRWDKVALEIPLKGLNALADVRGRLGALRTLSIDWRDCRKQDCRGTYDLFADAPLLENVRICRGPVGEVMVPYRHLRGLRLRDGKMNRRILLSTPKLVNLDLMDVIGAADEGDEQFRAEMSSLTSLRLYRTDHQNLARPLLEALVAPKLAKLEVSLNARPSGAVLPSVFNMLDRSRSTTGSCLTHLHLRCRFARPGDFYNILHILPALTHLNISIPFPTDIIELCSSSVGDGDVWLLAPHLKICAFWLGEREGTATSDKLIHAINCLVRARCDVKEVYRFYNRSTTSRVTWETKTMKDTRVPLRALYVCAPGSAIEVLQSRFRAAYDDFWESNGGRQKDVAGVDGIEECLKQRIRKHYEPQDRFPVDAEKTQSSLVYLPESNVIRRALYDEPGPSRWLLKTPYQFLNAGHLTSLNVPPQDRLWP